MAKLKWRCRRGTKELDYLLESYITNFYNLADKEEQLLFLELLNLQDSQLILLLLGDQLPDSKGIAQLVEKIRNNTNF